MAAINHFFKSEKALNKNARVLLYHILQGDLHNWLILQSLASTLISIDNTDQYGSYI